MKQSFEQQKATGFTKATLAVYFFRLRNNAAGAAHGRENAELSKAYVREARALGWRGRVTERKTECHPGSDESGPAGGIPCNVIPFVSREEKNRLEMKKRLLSTILEHARNLDW